jgi:hypothetical protein
MDEPDFKVEYPSENSVLFADRGRLANSLAFIHLAFRQDYREPIRLLDNMINELKTAYNKEMIGLKKATVSFSDQNAINNVWKGTDYMGLIVEQKQDAAFVIIHILEMFMRYNKQLKDLFSAVPMNYQESQPDRFTHSRTKRDLGLLVGGIALFNSVRNSFRLDELDSQFANLSSSHNQLVDSVSLLKTNFQQLEIDTQLILRLTTVLLKSNRKLLTTAVTLADRLRDTVDRIIAVITSGQRRKVNPRLLNGEEIVRVYRALHERANSMNADMILQDPTDLYEVEASYAFDPDTYRFEIILHVPLILKSESLKLYEFTRFPVLESLTLNATITPKVGEHKFLAVIPKNPGVPKEDGVASHMYRVLDTAELQSCSRIRDVYLCGLRNTLRSDITSSCIGSLWLQNNDLILKNCEMEVEPR